MADNTTTTPTPQSNGVPLSGLPALDAPVNGEELLLITKNNQSLKTTAAALKAYINAEMATLAGMQQAVKAVSDRLDTLVNGNASSAIDTFNEIEAFLTGITDTETLTGLLADLKSAITAETDNKLSGKVDKVAGKGLSTNDYTNDDKAKLTALPTSTQLTEKIDEGKDSAVLQSLIERAEACGVVYNKTTGFFEHNGIVDLTTAEVTNMLTHVNEIFLLGGRRLQNLRARTNIVTASTYAKGWNADFANLDGVCGGNQIIEVLKIGDCQVGRGSVLACFVFQCCKLRKVIGELDIFNVSGIRDAFVSASCLEEITLYGLKVSISFADCPLLSLASLQFLVTNAANTSAITITVHKDVYDKLNDASNAEWNAVLTSAEAKQITFATTN